MLKIDFTEKAIDEMYEQFMEHPSGLIKKKLHVVYLKAQVGVSDNEPQHATCWGSRCFTPTYLSSNYSLA